MPTEPADLADAKVEIRVLRAELVEAREAILALMAFVSYMGKYGDRLYD